MHKADGWHTLLAMKLKLYSAAQNSAGERVRIALHLKGLEYDYVPISSPKSGDYARINPQALMPTLDVEGIRITQSLAAIEYLEAQFPDPPLLPDDPLLKAQARSFALAICSELHALTVRRVRKYLLSDMEVGVAKVDQWYADWTHVTLSALEALLTNRVGATEFCFADFPTLADIALVPQLANARRFECDLSDFPLLRDIETRCNALTAFVSARPENQIDFRR